MACGWKKPILVLLAAWVCGAGAGPAGAVTTEQLYPPDDDNAALRALAAQPVTWASHDIGIASNDVATRMHVKMLAINDFHGQISAGKTVSGHPVGSAAVLTSYLHTAAVGYEDRCLIVHAGDHVGASPPSSALLQDEPSIMFFNMLGNSSCCASYRMDPLNNLVGTVGNHEFDEGLAELQRLIYGGNYATGPFLEDPYTGAHFPYVSANVLDAQTGQPVFLPYVIKQVAGMPIGFIGAVLKDTPTMVTASGVVGLTFADEAQSINHYVKVLQANGIHSIVVLLHQGDSQTSYAGATDPSKAGLPDGPALQIISNLDDEVDVVLSAHTHTFTNTIVKNKNGKGILTTQAYSAGTAYADITLGIDPATKDIVEGSASIITTYADSGPGLTPDAKVAALVAQAETAVAPLTSQVIGTAQTALTATQNAAGESALGNLIADAQRAALGTDFAFMNPGGIRADIPAGQVTWGALYTVQPFNNYLMRTKLKGQDIYDVLNQQWLGQPYVKMLQISGLTYTWDNSLPVGSRIVDVRKGGVSISRTATYTATINNFLAGGGDNFVAFKNGTETGYGPVVTVDLDALVTYIKGLAQPFGAAIEGRVTRLN